MHIDPFPLSLSGLGYCVLHFFISTHYVKICNWISFWKLFIWRSLFLHHTAAELQCQSNYGRRRLYTTVCLHKSHLQIFLQFLVNIKELFNNGNIWPIDLFRSLLRKVHSTSWTRSINRMTISPILSFKIATQALHPLLWYFLVMT